MSKTLNNKLILGTVQMGLSYGINNTKGKIALDESLEILNYAFENGVDILDSAEAYGNAHEVIGLFHEKNTAKKFRIITKLPNLFGGDILDKVAAYLEELKVTELHALLFHSFASYKNGIEHFGVLRTLRSEGTVKNLGVSVYTNEEIEEVLENDDIDIVQLPFNLFDNTNLRGEILRKAKAKGKTIHTRSALLQGLFFKAVDDTHTTVQALKSELALLSNIAKRHQLSIPELALGYCAHQETIDNVLIGVDSIDQLKDNLTSANHKMAPTLLAAINGINIKNPDLLNPSLWK